MRKLLAIIVLGLIFSGNAYSEKIETIFGFSLEVPQNYYYTGAVVGKDIEIPEKFMKGVTNPNLLFFFPKSLNPNKNSINVSMQPNVSLEKTVEPQLSEICSHIKKTNDEKFNLNLKQHECSLEELSANRKVFYVLSDGHIQGTLHVQLTYQYKKNIVTFNVLCEAINCKQINSDADQIIISLFK